MCVAVYVAVSVAVRVAVRVAAVWHVSTSERARARRERERARERQRLGFTCLICVDMRGRERQTDGREREIDTQRQTCVYDSTFEVSDEWQLMSVIHTCV